MLRPQEANILMSLFAPRNPTDVIRVPSRDAFKRRLIAVAWICGVRRTLGDEAFEDIISVPNDHPSLMRFETAYLKPLLDAVSPEIHCAIDAMALGISRYARRAVNDDSGAGLNWLHAQRFDVVALSQLFEWTQSNIESIARKRRPLFEFQQLYDAAADAIARVRTERGVSVQRAATLIAERAVWVNDAGERVGPDPMPLFVAGVIACALDARWRIAVEDGALVTINVENFVALIDAPYDINGASTLKIDAGKRATAWSFGVPDDDIAKAPTIAVHGAEAEYISEPGQVVGSDAPRILFYAPTLAGDAVEELIQYARTVDCPGWTTIDDCAVVYVRR